MNNQDKINILHDALTQYYDTEITKKKEKLGIQEAKKVYDEYEEISLWIDDLCQTLDMGGDKVNENL